jgi:hypothetical protein
MALFSISARKISLCLAFNNLESRNKGCEKSLGNITAAAKTGPAKQPLPASSKPASRQLFLKQGLSTG